MAHPPNQSVQYQLTVRPVQCWWKSDLLFSLAITLQVFLWQHWIQKLGTAGRKILHRFKIYCMSWYYSLLLWGEKPKNPLLYLGKLIQEQIIYFLWENNMAFFLKKNRPPSLPVASLGVSFSLEHVQSQDYFQCCKQPKFLISKN